MIIHTLFQFNTNLTYFQHQNIEITEYHLRFEIKSNIRILLVIADLWLICKPIKKIAFLKKILGLSEEEIVTLLEAKEAEGGFTEVIKCFQGKSLI